MPQSRHVDLRGTRFPENPATGVQRSTSGNDIVHYDVAETSIDHNPLSGQAKSVTYIPPPLHPIELGLRASIDATLQHLGNPRPLRLRSHTLRNQKALIIAPFSQTTGIQRNRY